MSGTSRSSHTRRKSQSRRSSSFDEPPSDRQSRWRSTDARHCSTCSRRRRPAVSCNFVREVARGELAGGLASRHCVAGGCTVRLGRLGALVRKVRCVVCSRSFLGPEPSIALRLHLDASTKDNGPLRVLPGSHSLGVLSDDEVYDHAKTGDSVECLVGRGGVLAMRPLLIHSSSKAISAEPRRVLHIEYADTLDLAPGIRLAVA